VGRWFGNMRRTLAGAFHSFPPAIDHEGYAPFLDGREFGRQYTKGD
jgi:hypothetical protein